MNSKAPAWPKSDKASPKEIVEARTQLCLRCGLCCNGALFDSLRIDNEEVFKFRNTPLKFFAETRTGRPFSATQPCLCHVDGRCSIFPNRPHTCSGYSCNLLSSITNGRARYDEAAEIVAHAKKQFDWLHYHATRYGYFTPRIRTLKTLLFDFIKSALQRVVFIPLHKYELEFSLHAFQFMQTLDNYFEEDFIDDFPEFISLLYGSQIKNVNRRTRQYRYNMNGQIIEFVDCPEVIDPFSKIIKGYTNNALNKIEYKGDSYLRIIRLAERYYWDTPYPGPYSKAERELIDLDDLLAELHYNADSLNSKRAKDHFYLHAAAVEIADGLVLFVGDHRAGKTVLSLTLAARGYRLFGDDQISIDVETGHGASIGRAPLLRLPLGKDIHLGKLKKIYYQGIKSSSVFINTDSNQFAAAGEMKPIIGIILLNRKIRRATCDVGKINSSDMFKLLVDRSSIESGFIFASAIGKSLSSISSDTRKYILTYSDAVSASDMVLKLFEGHVQW